MNTLKTVTVTYHSGSSSLSIDPPELSLEHSTGVYWMFENIPSGCVPQIYFDTAFGPFHSLRMLPSGAILGRGKIDLPGPSSQSYSYKALLLDSSGPRASGIATLTSAPQEGDSSPDVVVMCHRDSNGEFSLEIEPMHLYLYTGDAAAWHIRGLPPGFFITIVFYNYVDPWKGPFETFLLDRPMVGDDQNQFLAIGLGFASPVIQMAYRIEVRDEDGHVIKTRDPLIDNIGDPPTGGT